MPRQSKPRDWGIPGRTRTTHVTAPSKMGTLNLNCSCARCREAWRVAHLRYMRKGDNLRKHAERQQLARGTERQYEYEPRLNARKDLEE